MNSMLLKLATTQGTSLKVDSGDVSQGWQMRQKE